MLQRDLKFKVESAWIVYILTDSCPSYRWWRPSGRIGEGAITMDEFIFLQKVRLCKSNHEPGPIIFKSGQRSIQSLPVITGTGLKTKYLDDVTTIDDGTEHNIKLNDALDLLPMFCPKC